jgi:uncharacterized membrane protein YhaH (DUF805 family)
MMLFRFFSFRGRVDQRSFVMVFGVGVILITIGSQVAGTTIAKDCRIYHLVVGFIAMLSGAIRRLHE